MNENIIINTEQETTTLEKIETFPLVTELHPALHETLPVFDFANPPVDPMKFASSLVETCKKFKGLGLSANQCGFRHRVFVMGAGEEYVAFFNAKLVSIDDSAGEVHMEEGCLSFPFLNLRITRSKKINVEYQDFTGQVKTATFDGITARCFLHELDHMNGILYIDKAKPLALQFGMKKLKKFAHKIQKQNKQLMAQVGR